MTASPRTPWHCLDCDQAGDTQASATTANTTEAAARIAARARAGRREG